MTGPFIADSCRMMRLSPQNAYDLKLYVSGAMDQRWNNDELNPAFRSLAAGDFDVVRLGWR